MSSRNCKKIKSASYCTESSQQALKDVRDRGQGIGESCRKYGIPETTLQDRIHCERWDQLGSRGQDAVLGLDEEKKVVEWLLDIGKCGFPVKKQELLDTVQKYLKDLGRPNPFKDDRSGQTWYTSFLRRNPEISVLTSECINRAQEKVSKESVRRWFDELENYLISIRQFQILGDSKRIFNGAESGFALCPKSDKVLGPMGYCNLFYLKEGNEQDFLTVLVTFNAMGSICPTLVVFPYLRTPEAVMESMPPGWVLRKSDSGLMTSDAFFEYVTNDFNAFIENQNIKKPVLFLVDGCRTPMSLMLSSMCKELGIILYALPPKTTPILHPTYMSVIRPLKTHWKRAVRKFLSQTENVDKSVTKTNFCQLLQQNIENSKTQIKIMNRFEECGLYPFDEAAVDFMSLEVLNRTITDVTITNQDFISSRKVLRFLNPTLSKKNIDVRIILREIKKLRTNNY